jgi:hypothetical protein
MQLLVHLALLKYSSEPSQQSQMPSLTRELGIIELLKPALMQKNRPLTHADVPGSSLASAQSQ